MHLRHIVWTMPFLLSACATGPTQQPLPDGVPDVPTVSQVVTHQPPPTVVQPGPCEHLLWPLAEGASWRYQLTRADGSSQALTIEAKVAGDTAMLTLDAGAGPVESPVVCAPDGFYGALSMLIGHPDLGAGLVLGGPDRPFLPSPDQLLPLGAQAAWDVQYTAGGVLLLPFDGDPLPATVTGGDTGLSTVVLYATTRPLETVTTPAGTFNGLPVEQSALVNLQVTAPDGQTGSVFGDLHNRVYWAEGVGLVRQVFDGGTLSSTFAGAPVTLESGITLELVAYHGARP